MGGQEYDGSVWCQREKVGLQLKWRMGGQENGYVGIEGMAQLLPNGFCGGAWLRGRGGEIK